MSTKGVEEVTYLGSSSSSNCHNRSELNQSNSILADERNGNNKKFAWWAIILIILSLLLLFFTCCMMKRRRQDRDLHKSLDTYEQVKKGESDENDLAPYPFIDVTRTGSGSDVHTAVDVHKCQSMVCGSCATDDNSDEIHWARTDDVPTRNKNLT